MRFNLKRHKLLTKLSEKYFEHTDNFSSNLDAELIGLTNNQIQSFLKINNKERELILSELEKMDEIVPYGYAEKGYFIEPTKGLSAVTEKKYVKRNNDIILNWLRNFAQIFIPIASLIIAYLALSMNIAKNKKEYNEEIKSLENRIEQLENPINETKKIIETDSLKHTDKWK